MAASSFRCQWKYDVFVSFRGEDVRKSFMDHLFKDFGQKGILAFRDDCELPKGEVISPGLYKAIEESRFLIVIFSKNYASSSWCLRELVKILECKESGKRKHEVFVIFYDVKPDVVRKQTEGYAGIDRHESLNKTEVPKWKEALSKAANLSGWDLQDLANGYEAKFIDNISSEIFQKLCVGPLHVSENLVGVDNHVRKLNLLRFVGANKVHMFGVCGISGIGKTTLAKSIYNFMYTYFEGSCFCEDVQLQYLTQVQMQIIDKIMKTEDVKILTIDEGIMIIKQRMASKRVLLVLDNVDNHEQLEALAGSCDWFSKGTFIIFTSQDKQLLKSHKVDYIYDMPILPDHDAFELFRLHAFSQLNPPDEFKELAYQVVKHLQGHPLALKVLGRCLYEKPINVWKSQLDRLQTYPHADIRKKLRPSIDGLDLDQKRTFLEIACCFIGEHKDFAVNVLNDCDCFADVNIEVLVNRSLVTISHYNMSLQMHELIRRMAKEIVLDEYNMPGNHSRILWGPSQEVYDVLSEDKVTATTVEVLVLLLKQSSQKPHIHCKIFAHMKKLKILKICYLEQEDLGKLEDLTVNYSKSLDYLSNKLKLLHWHGYPFKFLPLKFYPESIVVIDLSYSNIKTFWATPKRFTRLKIMKLKHCRNLISTPDFTHITNLEELILEGCVNLIKIHPSIGMLKSLVVLNLSWCFKVDTLPQAMGKIKSLVELHINQSAITKLPSFLLSLPHLVISSFGQYESLWYRGLRTITQPSCVPRSLVLSSLAGLISLKVLNLRNCNILQVPEKIGGLSCLENLNLDENNFTSLPESLSRLSCLQFLGLSCCKKLKLFPKLPSSIKYLVAPDCNMLQVHGSLSYLSHLIHLQLDGCTKLEVFPDLPPSIKSVHVSYCNILQVPENIGRLSCLELLNMGRNNFSSLPRSLSQLSRLEWLRVSGCEKLEVFLDLPRTIRWLYASNCPKLVRNITVECVEPRPPETSITCHGATDKLPPLLRYIDIHSNICEFFHEQVTSLLLSCL